MTKRFGRLAAVVSGLAALIVAIPLAATGHDGNRAVIAERNLLVSFDPATGHGVQQGTFHAAGAISDTGSVTAPDFTVTPIGGGRARLEGDHVFTSPQGSFILHSRTILFPYPAARVISEGTWTVVSGTGAYANLEGKGKSLAVGDFTTGTVTIMRDGEVRVSDSDPDEGED